MKASDDESSSTIDFRSEIAVNRYRLTDFDCTPPLYISHTASTFFYFYIYIDVSDSFSKTIGLTDGYI